MGKNLKIKHSAMIKNIDNKMQAVHSYSPPIFFFLINDIDNKARGMYPQKVKGFYGKIYKKNRKFATYCYTTEQYNKTKPFHELIKI